MKGRSLDSQLVLRRYHSCRLSDHGLIFLISYYTSVSVEVSFVFASTDRRDSVVVETAALMPQFWVQYFGIQIWL